MPEIKSIGPTAASIDGREVGVITGAVVPGVTVFAVFKEGVYRHECGGIFSTQELAIVGAEALAAADYDGYHSYDVVPFTLDHSLAGEPRPYVLYDSTNHAPEQEPIYSVSKERPA